MPPVDPLFASKFHLFEGIAPDATREEWAPAVMPLFEAGQSDYVSPPVLVENRTIPGPQGEIPVRIYTPQDASSNHPGLVWYHGGAFMFGDLDMKEADVVSREIAHRANAVVMSVDYRLVTSERKFPTSQIDGLAAAQWFMANSASLGVDRNRITISGASAGACLTASVVLQLRDRNQLDGIRNILIYPIAHSDLPEFTDELSSKIAEVPPQLVFSRPDTKWINSNMGYENVDASYHCFPGDSADHSGLPETLIINSEYDSLRASGERYFEQLKAAGVTVSQLMAGGAMHGHLNWYPADCTPMEETLQQMTEFIVR
jgi:acetyl esterase/lipase